jgi:hypothetical protein
MTDLLLKINLDNYPLLNNIKEDLRQQIIQNIFDTGYNIHFPQINKNDITNNNEILNLEISNKLDNLESSLSKLIGISSNSAKKGEMAELILEKLINDRYGDIKFENKSQIPHSGDAWLYLPDDKIIMLESKNYTNTVNKDEVIKLESDMITHNIKWAIMVSFNSMIQGMKELDFHTFIHNNETYSIIIICNLSNDYHKLDIGLQIIRKLMLKTSENDNFPWIIKDITQNLNELNDVMKRNYLLRDSYYLLEKDIQKILSNYHVQLRDYQYELEQSINKIIDKIKSTTDKSIIINQEIKYDDLIEKYQTKKTFPIINRLIDLCQNKNWELNNEENDNWIIKNKQEIIGYVKIQIKKIIVNINDISFIFNLGNDKEIKQNLELMSFL